MNKDQVIGAAQKAAGRVQDAAGALSGDPMTQVDGKLRQVRGQARGVYGDLTNGLSNLAGDRPATSLAIALGVGVVLGLLAAR